MCLDASVFPYGRIVVVMFDELCYFVVCEDFFVLFIVDGAEEFLVSGMLTTGFLLVFNGFDNPCPEALPVITWFE
jgi:hypothetical protein